MHIQSDSVRKAAQTLAQQASVKGVKAHNLAQEKMDACELSGEKEGWRFWRNVWIQLMSAEHLRNRNETNNSLILD